MKIAELIEIKRTSVETENSNFRNIHNKLQEDIRKLLFKHREILELDEVSRFNKLRLLANKYLDELLAKKYKDVIISSAERFNITESVVQNLVGFGRLEPFLNDSTITEIMVNGLEGIFIERKGVLSKAIDEKGDIIRFRSNEEIFHIIDKIVSPINRKIDQSNPIVDARLPDGSRVNIVIPPATLNGPNITIRKFCKEILGLEKLQEFGSFDRSVQEYLVDAINSRKNIIVSGGTGSGKTTFLNALSKEIDITQRVVTIEDSAELQLKHISNLVSLESRNANIEGKGEITIRDLVKTALRMRPDRIVVGEVRGGEAFDMLQAMNTGHSGSLTTLHANSAKDTLFRLESMALFAGLDIPVTAIRKQIISAVDLIVFLEKDTSGVRRVKEMIELAKNDNDNYVLTTIYKV